MRLRNWIVHTGICLISIPHGARTFVDHAKPPNDHLDPKVSYSYKVYTGLSACISTTCVCKHAHSATFKEGRPVLKNHLSPLSSGFIANT